METSGEPEGSQELHVHVLSLTLESSLASHILK